MHLFTIIIWHILCITYCNSTMPLNERFLLHRWSCWKSWVRHGTALKLSCYCRAASLQHNSSVLSTSQVARYKRHISAFHKNSLVCFYNNKRSRGHIWRLKELVCLKMKHLSSFIHTRVVPNLSSAKHKDRYFVMLSTKPFWLPLTSIVWGKNRHFSNIM